MKTVLVTGGAGFLGSHLCEFLLSKGYRVLCVDNLITGTAQNIVHLKTNPSFCYIQHDISHPLTIQEEVHYVLQTKI